MALDYDLIVIGAGSGGLAAAERAAAYGARVAIAEESDIGGACVNYGCIPEKLLDYAATFKQLKLASSDYGWDELEPQFDWSHFITRKEQQIQRLNQLHLQHLKDAGVQLIQGHASFLDPQTLAIADQVVTADKVLIATGAKLVKPDIPGIEHAISWHELYHSPSQPQRIAIVGDGAISVKVAGSLNELGSQVTQIIKNEQILTEFDSDIGAFVQTQMGDRGVQFHPQTQVTQIEPIDHYFRLTLSQPQSPSSTVDVDVVFVDAPRQANLAGLNLEKAGIQLTASGGIRVDTFSRTAQTHVFAIGDCTDRPNLTPLAIAQGRAFADTEFGSKPHAINDTYIPISVSSHPEAATVGFSEVQAREKWGDAVCCYRTQFRPLFYSLTGRDGGVLLKVVVNRDDSERILGIHMAGYPAGEVIQSLAVALKLGATKTDLNQAIGIHPSVAEEFFTLF
jgi:glutathione reductase (NADPH)